MEYTKTVAGRKLFLGRPPGLAEKPLQVPFKGQYLALGADMATSVSACKGGQAFVSETIGSLAELDNLTKFRKTIGSMLEKFKVEPEKIVCDLHPGYESTKHARELAEGFSCGLAQVQHHLAHVQSVALENDLADFRGIAADGLGYGLDGNLWGGEVFDGKTRIGSLEEQYQLGGESATHHPEKMLLSILARFLDGDEVQKYVSFKPQDLSLLLQQLEQKFNCPITTSTGRILDAASVFLGFCGQREYPGSPAIILEQNSTEPYDLEPKVEKKDRQILKTTPIFEFLVENQDGDRSRLGATVQQYLAEGFYKIAAGDKPVVFSGGCAYNRIMTGYMLGQGAFVNEKVPCGDGGISFGQLGLADSGD